MGLWKLYRYENYVVAPRMVQTEQGVYLETEPVELVNVDVRGAVVDLLTDVLASAPAPAQENDLYNEEGDRFSAQSVLLAALSLKRWQDFERRAVLFTLHKTDAQINLHVTGRGDDGLWSISKSDCKTFDPSISNTELASLIAGELISAKVVEPPRLLGGPIMPLPKDEPKA